MQKQSKTQKITQKEKNNIQKREFKQLKKQIQRHKDVFIRLRDK